MQCGLGSSPGLFEKINNDRKFSGSKFIAMPVEPKERKLGTFPNSELKIENVV